MKKWVLCIIVVIIIIVIVLLTFGIFKPLNYNRLNENQFNILNASYDDYYID